MRAAIFHKPGEPLSIEEIDIDDPGPGEVLVDVHATGLCHSDLHFIEGHLPVSAPAVLGHETAGVVAKVGAGVAYLKPGDHVIGCLSAFCGACELCLSGRPSICEGGATINRGPGERPRLSRGGQAVTQFMNLSALAERILVHEHALARIDHAMPLDTAALIGCGVMVGYGAVARTARVEAGSSVAVIGCGSVGLNTIQSARIAGALDVIAIDINPARLALAATLGATATIDSSKLDSVTEVRKLTSGRGVHCSFEAVGNPKLAEQAFLMTRKGGTTVLMGLMGLEERISLPFGHFLAERRVMGCDMGSNQFRTDMPRLVRLYLDGRLKLDELKTATIPLERVNEGFAALRKGEGVRTVVRF